MGSVEAVAGEAGEVAESESAELESDCPASAGWDALAAGIRVAEVIPVEAAREATPAEDIPMIQATAVGERTP